MENQYFFFENRLIINSISQVMVFGYLLQVEFDEAYVTPVYRIIQEVILHLFKADSCH